jgi:hypothetical protein
MRPIAIGGGDHHSGYCGDDTAAARGATSDESGGRYEVDTG